MTKQIKFAKVIRFGISAAILSAAAFASGKANAQSVLCSASGVGGRQIVKLVVSARDPETCIRVYLGIPATVNLPSCWEAARAANLSCVDSDGSVNIIDLPQ
ncbi:MAG: hypothetical protein IPM54_04575 [Polyangiaceae bacterium]|nr:hypothetical protein [Polyangiaceae bacterium]